ncbi:MAG: hypothetical protein IJR50_05415 [Treponema sp.]|nr:hypothetical protein [Treponema sp.]
MIKKILLCVAAFIAAACLVSCADIFNGSGQDGVTVTIPAFSRASNASRAASTDSTHSGWNVYAYLISKDADSTVLGAVSSFQNKYHLSAMKEVAANPGILQAVSYKGVDFSHDVPVKFQRVKPGTEYFVLLAITYELPTNLDAKEEVVVFSGMSPQNALGGDSTGAAFSPRIAACHTAQSGVNEVALSLKKNNDTSVYFVSKDGSAEPSQSTPSKPCAFPLLSSGTYVIILTEDVTCSSLDIANFSATIMSLPGKACMLTLKDDKDSFKELDICQSGTLALVDVTLVAKGGIVRAYGALAVGGAVRIVLHDEKAYIDLEENSNVFLVSPPELAAGKKICTIKMLKPKQECTLSNYFKGFDDPAAYFNIEYSSGPTSD